MSSHTLQIGISIKENIIFYKQWVFAVFRDARNIPRQVRMGFVMGAIGSQKRDKPSHLKKSAKVPEEMLGAVAVGLMRAGLVVVGRMNGGEMPPPRMSWT
jgi:hypothetical protein